jgi:hypothetical protein
MVVVSLLLVRRLFVCLTDIEPALAGSNEATIHQRTGLLVFMGEELKCTT